MRLQVIQLLSVLVFSDMVPCDAFPLLKSGSASLMMAGQQRQKKTFREAVKMKKVPETQLKAPFQSPLPSRECDSRLDAQTTFEVMDDDKLASLGVASLITAMTAMTALSESADAIQMPKELALSSGSFDPSSFVPVCPASDGLYRFFQGSAKTIVGADNFQEYGPLIASGLLRVRLELCVVESFFNEAVGPFIRQNGLSWVLPIHETVETFLAGSVFALATTFILVGSTKILTVIFTYADFLLGGPLRLLGGFAFDRARGKPVILDFGLGPFKTRVIGPKGVEVDENDWTVDLTELGPADVAIVVISGGAKAAGTAIKVLREVLDAIDLFVGKSLVLWATAYIAFKFVHFKVFPDFPPF